jgi:hypothetical protein
MVAGVAEGQRTVLFRPDPFNKIEDVFIRISFD